MSNSVEYTPENPAEELFELVGRLKAFEDFLSIGSADERIEKEVCAKILGLRLKNENK